jgi:hypothetical protein
MVFFPLCGVLRGFSAATYTKYVSRQTLVRLDEHIDVKNQDVKSRRMAGPNEKNPHL